MVGVAELGTPPAEECVEPLALQLFALPDGEVRVLDWQWRQRGCAASREGGIQLRQFAKDDIARPAVECNVVRLEQQHVLRVAERHEGDAEQKVLQQIERPSAAIANHLRRGVVALRRCDARKINDLERDGARWGHHLHGLILVRRVGRTQTLVSLDERIVSRTPNDLLIFPSTRMAISECPPSAMKLSVTPMSSLRSISDQMAATRFSVSVRGATRCVVTPAVSGAGNAFVSTLPFGVRGSASRRTMAHGTMYAGRVAAIHSVSVSGVGLSP